VEKPGTLIIVCRRMAFLLLLFFWNCHQNPKTKSDMTTQKSVKGIMLDQAGSPVEDAIVMLTGNSGSSPDIAGSSNEKGEFYLDNLKLPGTYAIQINRNGTLMTKTITLSESDTVFTVRL
jgi:hypothetical protein